MKRLLLDAAGVFRLSKKHIQGGIGGRSPLMEIRHSDMCGVAEGLA